MGVIERLESGINRQSTYVKRKNGLVKKVQLLSALCDVDVALVMFSPAGKPTLCHGQDRDPGAVLQKLTQISFHEREGRTRESLDHVKKIMRRLKHNVDTKEFHDESIYKEQKVQGLQARLQQVNAEIDAKAIKLSMWREPERIGDLQILEEMERTVLTSMYQLRLQQENLIENSGTITGMQRTLIRGS